MSLWPLRSKRTRKVAVFFADTHGGHRLGLMRPGTELEDEGPDGEPLLYEPRLTGVQEWLAECFEEDLGKAKDVADGAEIILIHDGDLTQGTKYPYQLVSTRKADQVTIATGNMEWAMDRLPNVTKVRLIHGTEAHGFLEGTADHLVAARLRAGHPGMDIRCLSHGLFQIGEEGVDCAHHGPGPGIRKWLDGNVLRLYARSIMMDSLMRGERPPALLVRGHRHRYRHETVRVYFGAQEFVTEAYILPSYSGLTHHARQTTQSVHWLGTGLLAAEFEDGQLTGCHAFWRDKDLRTREEL